MDQDRINGDEGRKRSEAIADALNRRLIAKGYMHPRKPNRTPKPPGEFRPIEVRGKSLSEIIIEERGPR